MDLQAALGRAGLVVILANSGPAATSGQRLDQPHIVVSVVNEAGVSPRIISDGQLRITAIYEAIGVAVTWVDTYLRRPQRVCRENCGRGRSRRRQCTTRRSWDGVYQ